MSDAQSSYITQITNKMHKACLFWSNQILIKLTFKTTYRHNQEHPRNDLNNQVNTQ